MAERALGPAAPSGVRAFAPRLAIALRLQRAVALTQGLRPGLAMAAAAGAILLVHLPVLRYYFFGDDFVPLADIASRSNWRYVRDLFLLRDLTPNWRFLTGLFYLGAYRAFGLNAFPFLLANVLVHIATSGLIFWLVRRVAGEVWPAFLAAAFFGLTAAHAPTVAQVTAFNNVLAGFLVMLAVVLLYEGLERRLPWCTATSAFAFAGAIAANEPSAVLAPVFGLIVLWKFSDTEGWWRDRRQWARLALLSAPYAAVGAAALATLGACRCTEGASLYAGGEHLVTNVWLYLGRLLYPVGLEFPGHVGAAHVAAGITVTVLAAAALLRGPALARISVVFLLLALIPYLPIELWAASRYTYTLAIPFSLLAALLFSAVARYGVRLTPALPALVALVAFGVLGIYSWQTWEQNQAIGSRSDDWRSLVTELRDAYPELPQGSTVYVRGGPLTEFYLQCAVMPAVGEVLWGDVKLFTSLQGDLEGYRIRPGYNVYVLADQGGRLVPASVRVASAGDLTRNDLVLLPQVSPEATGNLCLPDTPKPR